MSLGEAYSDVFNKVVVTEDTPAGQIGDAPLTKGGPEEEGGYREPLVDITKISDKALGISFPFENLYEITTYLESRKLKNTKDFLVITIA